MKTTIYTILASLMTLSVWAGDPVWLEDKTDAQYQITVYHSPSCGCCKSWISHLKDHDFEVTGVPVENVNKFKTLFNVPSDAASCHTALVNGITIEGHVPAQDIKRLLTEKSDIRLLTVPAMPSGTPGMDMAGAAKDNFNVYSVDKHDQVEIYRSYSSY